MSEALDKINVVRLTNLVRGQLADVMVDAVFLEPNDQTTRDNVCAALSGCLKKMPLRDFEVSSFSYVSYVLDRRNKLFLTRSDGKIDALKRSFRSRRIGRLAAKRRIKSMINIDISIQPIQPITRIEIKGVIQ